MQRSRYIDSQIQQIDSAIKAKLAMVKRVFVKTEPA
jgi:hypothetical protein